MEHIRHLSVIHRRFIAVVYHAAKRALQQVVGSASVWTNVDYVRDILRGPLHVVVCCEADTTEARRGVGRGRKKKVQLPGVGEVDAEIIPFRGDVEHWNEYLLDDGTVVRMKAVVTEIARVDGHYDQEGNPAYVVFSANVTHVSSPEDLKKGGGQP